MADPSPADRLRRLLERVAPYVEAGEAELGRRKRFQAQADGELMGLVRDRAGAPEVRSTALAVLVERHRKGTALSALLIELIDDPDEELARQAIRSAPPFDPALADRLRRLVDDPRGPLRSEAALALARRKDPKLLRKVAPWLLGGDEDRARVALACLEWLLPPEDRAELIGRALGKGPAEPWRRALLAGALDRLEAGEGP